MMTHEEVQQQLDGYALGVLDDVSARRIAAHLAEGCNDCQSEMDAWQATVGALGYATAPATPSPAVKDRLMSRARSARQIKPPPEPIIIEHPVVKTDWRGWAAAAVLLIALGGTIFYAINLRQRIDSAEAQLNRQESFLALLNARDTNVTTLAPIGDKVTVAATILWNPNQKRWTLVGNSLPAAPVDKSYQLWFIVNGQKVSGGVFKSASETSAENIPAQITSADVIAITLEKAGGSPQPEGPIVLAGKAS